MRGYIHSLFFCLALLWPHGIALAQTSGAAASANKNVPATPPTNFSYLFPKPTNNNGYEEWVQAADLMQSNGDVDTAALPTATLTFKRHVLAEPIVAQALLLLRAGLDKPIASPHTNFNENTRLPELSLFRKLARLLRTEQYVNFADGHVGAAIDDLRIGLAFAYRIQTDSLISGLVGIAVDTIMLEEFARHFDQLSVGQCDQVLRLVTEFINAENPAVRLLMLEKDYEIKMLEARRSNPDSLIALLDNEVNTNDTSNIANVQSLQESLTRQPDSLNTIINDAENRINALFARVFLNMRLPIAQRVPLAEDTAHTPGAIIASLVTPNLQAVLDRYTGDQAKMRLLAIHALIHRYRWEHNALPDTLADLHAENFITDPFTGEHIVYRRDNDRYTLYSQGPFKRDENGHAGTERTAVKLTH